MVYKYYIIVPKGLTFKIWTLWKFSLMRKALIVTFIFVLVLPGSLHLSVLMPEILSVMCLCTYLNFLYYLQGWDAVTVCYITR